MKYADQTSEIRRTWPEETTRSCLNVRVNETSEHTKKKCQVDASTLMYDVQHFPEHYWRIIGRVAFFLHMTQAGKWIICSHEKAKMFYLDQMGHFCPPPPCGNVSVMPLPKTSYITFPSDPFVKFHSSLRWSAGPESALVSTLVVNRGERAVLFLAEPRPGPKQKLSKRT